MTPFIVCEGIDPAAPAESVWLWVLRENAAGRLDRLSGAALPRAELDERVSRLREQGEVWRARIETFHAPPSLRFRLVWTVPPAPCRVYTRKGLVLEVEPTGVIRHLGRRRQPLSAASARAVEGFVSDDWTYAGMRLIGPGGAAEEILRVRSVGLFGQFLLGYDGIDRMVDTAWLDHLGPRVAAVLGLPWTLPSD